MDQDSPGLNEIKTFQNQLAESTQLFAQRIDTKDKGRHQGNLVGNIKDELLLIAGFDDVEFGLGEHIVLRMVMGNYLIGFRAEVIKKINDPVIYIVNFPINIESINLRKTDRINAFFPAEVHLSTTNNGEKEIQVLQTRIVDISIGGCSFRSKTRLKENIDVGVTFTLPGDRVLHTISGTVLQSVHAKGVFNNRIKFGHENLNLPIIDEIDNWVTESLSFAIDGE